MVEFKIEDTETMSRKAMHRAQDYTGQKVSELEDLRVKNNRFG